MITTVRSPSPATVQNTHAMKLAQGLVPVIRVQASGVQRLNDPIHLMNN